MAKGTGSFPIRLLLRIRKKKIAVGKLHDLGGFRNKPSGTSPAPPPPLARAASRMSPQTHRAPRCMFSVATPARGEGDSRVSKASLGVRGQSLIKGPRNRGRVGRQHQGTAPGRARPLAERQAIRALPACPAWPGLCVCFKLLLWLSSAPPRSETKIPSQTFYRGPCRRTSPSASSPGDQETVAAPPSPPPPRPMLPTPLPFSAGAHSRRWQEALVPRARCGSPSPARCCAASCGSGLRSVGTQGLSSCPPPTQHFAFRQEGHQNDEKLHLGLQMGSQHWQCSWFLRVSQYFSFRSEGKSNWQIK